MSWRPKAFARPGTYLAGSPCLYDTAEECPDIDCSHRDQDDCSACSEATGGVCAKHQEPECTCYELTGGHQPGCYFARPRSP